MCTCTTERMTAKGHSATLQQVRATSALPPQSGHALTRLARQFRANRDHRQISFDDLVGGGEQHGRYREAQRFGGLEIDRQIEFGRLLYR